MRVTPPPRLRLLPSLSIMIKITQKSGILRRERSMGEEAQIFFGALADRTHDFYRRYRKAEAYGRLTKEAVLAVFDSSLAPDAPGRRKLSLRVSSRRHRRGDEKVAGGGGGGGGVVMDEGEVIVLRSLEDIRAFKESASVYD